jgi:rare lipoprotein A
MQFLQLCWLSSWVGCFLAFSQGLWRVPEYLSTAYQLGSDRTQLQSNSPSPTTSPPAWINDVEKSLCRPASKPVKQTLQSNASWVAISPTQASTNSIPEKILHVMQNLFNWRQGEARSPVVVVSTNSQNQTINTSVINQPRAQLGISLYLQWLSGDVADAKPAPTPKQELFQVWVKGHLIAQIPDQLQANLIAQQLATLFKDSNLDASQLQPALVNGMPAGKLGDRLLFIVDDTLAKDLNQNPQLLAIEWINNLRKALNVTPLTLAEAQMRMYGLAETPAKVEGFASWYGDYFHGRLTANGETYNQYDLTAAHRSLPFNTYLKVTNEENGEAVIVRVNDRGPYIPPRSLDLSRVAARCINGEDKGVVPFKAVILQPLPNQSPATDQELVLSRSKIMYSKSLGD